MGLMTILIGLLLAGALLSMLPRVKGAVRTLTALGALVVLAAAVILSSIRVVPEDRLGVVIKNALGPKLQPGAIIATKGEMGTQARILPPGWHFGFWPVIFEVDLYPMLVVETGQVGLLKAHDGLPLPDGQIYAPEWADASVRDMLNAEHFLGAGSGYKGPQSTVLTPGMYRINPKLFELTTVPVVNIPPASVGVVKANVGTDPPPDRQGHGHLVDRGQRGVWRTPLPPQEYYMNVNAYEVTQISTGAHIVEYTVSRATKSTDQGEREIQVRSADGFTFPVDVRVEYIIDPQNAPQVVATLKDDREPLQNVLNSAVRAIFRNATERVKALEYVQQRSQQEKQALEALAIEMRKYGVTITAVRIGNIGDNESLGVLLKTQTDREIAQQEQVTFQQQQKAAEQKKALARTQQEAEEEKRLATANYQVKIAGQDKERKLIEASAEADSIKIRAQAEAQAFSEISRQIGPSNSALLQMLRVIGERGIEITPRVMISGQSGPSDASKTSPETVALIGTMLESMIDRSFAKPAEPAAVSGASAAAPVKP